MKEIKTENTEPCLVKAPQSCGIIFSRIEEDIKSIHEKLVSLEGYFENVGK